MSESNRDIAKKYYELFYDMMLCKVLGSITHEEFEYMRDPDKMDIDMEYNEFMEAIEGGVDQQEIDKTINHIEEFLQKYVEFQKEEYYLILKEFLGQATENIDELKQHIAAQFENSEKSEDDEPESKKHRVEVSEQSQNQVPVMRSGNSELQDVSIFGETEEDRLISIHNEERGVLRLNVGGSDIEVFTYGYVILSNLYASLFAIFSLMNQMTIKQVRSEAPVKYSLKDEDDGEKQTKFTFRLDPINSNSNSNSVTGTGIATGEDDV